MFLTQRGPEQGRLENFRYGTAGTTTQTTLASSGGLLVNIDSATGDIATTLNGTWIENEKYGWYVTGGTGTFSAEFDTSRLMTGSKTLKLSTTTVAGTVRANTFLNAAGATLNQLSAFKINTKYKLGVWVETVNLTAGNTILLFSSTSQAAGATLNNIATININSGTTTSKQYYTTTFTSNGTDIYVGLQFRISTAGNISDAWFDINSMTLEEVVEPVANSLTSSSPSLVSFTAVGSTDNIDQSQLTFTNSFGVGSGAGVNYMGSQSFTPTKSKHTGVTLYKKANVGTPTGNFKVDVRTDNAGDPSSTILATYTMPLATYNALTTNADFTVNLPCNLTPGTKYHYVISNTATETGTNNFQIGAATVGGYTGGDNRQSTNGGTIWSINGTADLYFKTLYYKPTTNFKASQNNQSVSISADEEGFIEAGVHNITTGTWSFTDPVNDGATQNNMYYERHVGTTFSGNTVQFAGANRYYILKINLGVPASGDMTYTIGYITNNTISYSYDNVTYYTLGTLVASGGSYTIPMTGYSTVYIKNNANAIGSMTNHSGSCPINISSLSTLKNYPTNKDIIKQYSTTLGSATTSATYRATKWGFPAIEYSSTEYQYLDIDTTATGSTVAFSELGTSYTTVADGASLAITSTSNPTIFVKHNITANRLYVSSNDLNASSDKDGSLKQSVVYQVIQ